MAADDTSEHVARYIPNLLSGLDYGKNVRLGPPNKPSTNQSLANAVPERCVFVLMARGSTSEAHLGGGGIKKPLVQVWVRGKRNNYEDARDLAFSIFEAIDKKPPPGYFECRALYSSPEYVQQDEVGSHEFLITLDLRGQV
jgi:hypothetical protein